MKKAKREVFSIRWNGNEFWSDPSITKLIVSYYIGMMNLWPFVRSMKPVLTESGVWYRYPTRIVII
ncbi:Uncharacterised protein [uncultured archaeon]|nr:Uncharacterised protein [uncultured archaeon]